jgi:hypothetical protein
MGDTKTTTLDATSQTTHSRRQMLRQGLGRSHEFVPTSCDKRTRFELVTADQRSIFVFHSPRRAAMYRGSDDAAACVRGRLTCNRSSQASGTCSRHWPVSASYPAQQPVT